MRDTKSSDMRTAHNAITGSISRINDFGLCEVRSNDDVRIPFTLDKLQGYRGQQLNEIGLRVGMAVRLERDAEGRVTAARVGTLPAKEHAAAGS